LGAQLIPESAVASCLDYSLADHQIGVGSAGESLHTLT
jgi:hypothetical protein